MSDAVVLTLATAPTRPLVAECVVADRFASLGARDIGQLPVTHGGQRARLGDFFTVTGERSATLRIAGDLAKVEGIGAAVPAFEMLVCATSASWTCHAAAATAPSGWNCTLVDTPSSGLIR